MKKNMMEKNSSIHPKSQNNQMAKEKQTPEQQIISHYTRLLTIQDHLNKTNFKLNAFLGICAQQAQYLTHADGVLIDLVEKDEMICQAASGKASKSLQARSDKNKGIVGLALSTHQAILCNDCKNDPRFEEDEGREMSAASLIVVPLFQQAHAVGIIKVISTNENAFNDIDIQTIRIIAGLISSAITYKTITEDTKKLIHEKNHALDDLRKSEKKLKSAAHHDYLTGLPNRNLFNDQLALVLAKAKRRKQLVALMYLDIDNFKNVNDTHGHTIGDKLLRAFALRLKQCVRSSDIAARIGGDEFVLLVDDIKDTQDCIVIAEKVLQSMRQAFSVDEKTFHITTSIGIAILKDPDIIPDNFIKQADQALYVSKNSGRNTFYIFDNELLYERALQ